MYSDSHRTVWAESAQRATHARTEDAVAWLDLIDAQGPHVFYSFPGGCLDTGMEHAFRIAATVPNVRKAPKRTRMILVGIEPEPRRNDQIINVEDISAMNRRGVRVDTVYVDLLIYWSRPWSPDAIEFWSDLASANDGIYSRVPLDSL